jgi:hypothetical protein
MKFPSSLPAFNFNKFTLQAAMPLDTTGWGLGWMPCSSAA